MAIETSAIRLGLVNPNIYRDMHVLYHAIIEALRGVTRGQVELGGLLRTAGLRFAIARGRPFKTGTKVNGLLSPCMERLEHKFVDLNMNRLA